MESIYARKTVGFAALQTRLIGSVNTRIQNGEFTERGLARMLGLSQSQVHNVLKGARRFRPELADRILQKFGMSLLQLLEDRELGEELLLRRRLEPDRRPE